MKGSLAVSFIMLLCAQTVLGAEVRFADPNLEAAAEAALGKADPNTTDMLALKELVVSQELISDLTGLEHARNLEVLGLYRSQVNNLSPLAGLTKLRILVFKGGL